MATKKECDRCGKQWKPAAISMAKDTELATVEICIPYNSVRRYDERDQVIKSYELCQTCARQVHKVLETKPTGHGVASGQHQHTVPGVDPSKYTVHLTGEDNATKRVQKEIMGEPDE